MTRLIIALTLLAIGAFMFVFFAFDGRVNSADLLGVAVAVLGIVLLWRKS